MAQSIKTKKALAQSLKKLMQERPFGSISIEAICASCGMSRKIFYYHFKDKFDLVNWIFDTEFVAVVEEKVKKDSSRKALENETAADKVAREWEELIRILYIFYDNRDFYKKAFLIEGQNSFEEHFRTFCYPVFEKELQIVFDEGELTDFQVIFFTDAILCSVRRWLTAQQPMMPEDYAKNLLASIIVPALQIVDGLDMLNLLPERLM